jgi:hypothetical protein
MLFVVVATLVLAACGAAPATQAPLEYIEPAAATEAPAMQAPSFAEEPAAKEGENVEQDQAAAEVPLVPMPTAAAYEISNPSEFPRLVSGLLWQ